MGGVDDQCLQPMDLMLDGPVCKPAKSTRSVLLGGGGNTHPDISRLLLTNVNYFAYRGGFDAIARLIDPPVTPATQGISLGDVQALVELVAALSIYFSKKFCSSFLSDFQIAVHRRISLIANDADLRDILDSSPDGMGIVEDIWKDLTAILRVHWKDYPLFETFGNVVTCVLRVIHFQYFASLYVSTFPLPITHLSMLSRTLLWK